jgi:hypothetical protein
MRIGCKGLMQIRLQKSYDIPKWCYVNFLLIYTDRDSKSGRRAKSCASDFKRSKQPLFEDNRGDAELLKYVDAWEGPLFES